MDAWRKTALRLAAEPGRASCVPGLRSSSSRGLSLLLLTLGLTGFSRAATGGEENRGPRGESPAVRVEGSKVYLKACANDPDGDPLTFRWTQTGGPSVKLSNAASQETCFVPTEPGTYEFEVRASDGRMESAPASVRVTVSAPDLPPSAVAGRDEEMVLGQDAFLSATGSFDPEGRPLEHEWRQVDGPPMRLSRTVLKSKDVKLRPEKTGRYVFELKVFDGKHWSEPARVTLTVAERNSTPVVRAPGDAEVKLPVVIRGPGPDVPSAANRPPTVETRSGSTLTIGGEIVLDGSATSDPDGDVLEYWWDQIGGPGIRAMKGRKDLPVWRCRPDRPGTYVFRLTVKDGRNEAMSSPVTFVVHERNVRPQADAGRDVAAEVGEMVRLDGSRSRDADGDRLTFRWIQTEGPRVLNWRYEDLGRPDRPGFVPEETGEYAFELTVNDGSEDSAPASVRVTVVPANRPPSVSCARCARAPIGQPIRIRADGTDPDDNALTYRWNMVEGPARPDVPQDAWAQRSFEFVPSVPGLYLLEVVVSDGKLKSGAAACQVGVDGPNLPPTAHIVGPDSSEAGKDATLDGSQSCDPDKDRLAFRWSQLSGSALKFKPDEAVIAVTPSEPGEYSFGLIVDDGRAKSRQATFTLRVRKPEAPAPERNAPDNNGRKPRPSSERNGEGPAR